MLKSFYVDDLLTSVSDETTVAKMISGLRNLLHMGGFKLTKWITTSRKVMLTIPEEERAPVVQDLCLGDAENKVLGMMWNIEADVFRFEINVEDKPVVRRFIFSVTNRLFDPLGLVAPVVIEARLIFRETCKLNMDWDELLPRSYMSRWNSWINSLVGLDEIAIRRCFKPAHDQIKNHQLHVFADAFVVARGAVCYLRTEYKNGLVHCSVVMAKALLASSENMTIPRMELEAAVDAVKLAHMVREEFKLACSCTYWTDSSIVLQSIRADTKRFPVFARNRSALIDKYTSVNDWRHVPSQFNPADLISRGPRATELVKTHEWFDGPSFLQRPLEDWPKQFQGEAEDDKDLVRSFNLQGKCNVSLLARVSDGDGMD